MSPTRRRKDDGYRKLFDISIILTIAGILVGGAMWVQAKDDSVDLNTKEIVELKKAVSCLEKMKIDIATTKKDVETINDKQDSITGQLTELRRLVIKILQK
jgi:hypothetical protein